MRDQIEQDRADRAMKVATTIATTANILDCVEALDGAQPCTVTKHAVQMT